MRTPNRLPLIFGNSHIVGWKLRGSDPCTLISVADGDTPALPITSSVPSVHQPIKPLKLKESFKGALFDSLKATSASALDFQVKRPRQLRCKLWELVVGSQLLKV